MSHDATGWAIKQRGLKPATKIVLWQLCDRFHPDNGCFPSQETLSNVCEMSRSSLNEHLDALELAGLIRREQRRENCRRSYQTSIHCALLSLVACAGLRCRPRRGRTRPPLHVSTASKCGS